MKIIGAVMLALTICAPVGAMAQTVYKCVQDGKKIFQGVPCPVSAKQETLKAQAAASSPGVGKSQAAAASAPGAGSEEDVKSAIEIMSAYRACTEGSQYLKESMAATIQSWRYRNGPMVQRIESDSKLNAQLQERIEAKRNGMVSMCGRVSREMHGPDAELDARLKAQKDDLRKLLREVGQKRQ